MDPNNETKDYHNEMRKELEEKNEEIAKLKRILKKCQVCDKEKMRRITYLENKLALKN